MADREWYGVEEVRSFLIAGGIDHGEHGAPIPELVPHSEWIAKHFNLAFNKGHFIGSNEIKNHVAAFLNGTTNESELATACGLFNHREQKALGGT